MRKWIVLMGISIGMLSSVAYADALKNSLTNIMNTDDSVSMVDLDNLNLNKKAKPVKKVIKNRPANTVVGTVNGHQVIKKDADAYLLQRTQGKISNYDSMAVKQQKMLLQEIGLPYLAYDAAVKELTHLEKETILNRTWMQKEAQKIQIKDDEVFVVYDNIRQQSLDANSTKPIPKFEEIKERLRMQMIEKQMMMKLMQGVKIEVLESSL